MSRLICLGAIALLLATLAGGCAAHRQAREVDRAVRDYYTGDYTAARERLRPLADKTNENFVLNNVRLGSAALGDYDLVEAEAAFLRAYEVMNAVGVDDGGRTLGAILIDEGIRVWRGEPFERAMASFYLGLIYYMQEDYHNARGAFENALFRLRDYGEGDDDEDRYREFESNFTLAYLMLGKSWQKLGREDLARANFERVVQLRPRLAPVADYDLNAASNLLLVLDYGVGPSKVTTFDGAIAGFAPTPAAAGPVPRPRVLVNGRQVPLNGADRPTVDLLALAQDRRWHSLDTIRTVRSAVGTGLIIAGAHQATRTRTVTDPGRGPFGLPRPQPTQRTGEPRRNVMTRRQVHDPNYGAAAALIGAGLLLKATSQADIRQWEMLPRTVFVIPLRVEPGVHEITVDFPGSSGYRQTWRNIPVPEEGEATYYFRLQRWNRGPFDWPPDPLH